MNTLKHHLIRAKIAVTLWMDDPDNRVALLSMLAATAVIVIVGIAT